jgi:hypothetical protein
MRIPNVDRSLPFLIRNNIRWSFGILFRERKEGVLREKSPPISFLIRTTIIHAKSRKERASLER